MKIFIFVIYAFHVPLKKMYKSLKIYTVMKKCNKCKQIKCDSVFLSDGEVYVTCLKCRTSKSNTTRRRSFYIDYTLNEPVYMIDLQKMLPIAGNINIDILKLKKVILSLCANKIYLHENNISFKCIVNFRSPRSITAILGLIPLSIVIFDTEKCKKILSNNKGFLNLAKEPNTSKEIPYFSKQSKREIIKRERNEEKRLKSIELTETKNYLIESFMSEIHPFLNLTPEEYQYLDDYDKIEFYSIISDLLRSNLAGQNFEYVKLKVRKYAEKHVESDLKRKNDNNKTSKREKEKIEQRKTIIIDPEEMELFKKTYS
jgi:hypothetical protein